MDCRTHILARRRTLTGPAADYQHGLFIQVFARPFDCISMIILVQLMSCRLYHLVESTVPKLCTQGKSYRRGLSEKCMHAAWLRFRLDKSSWNLPLGPCLLGCCVAEALRDHQAKGESRCDCDDTIPTEMRVPIHGRLLPADKATASVAMVGRACSYAVFHGIATVFHGGHHSDELNTCRRASQLRDND